MAVMTNCLGYQEVWVGEGPTAARRVAATNQPRSQAFTARGRG